jgi:hypothetical protein
MGNYAIKRVAFGGFDKKDVIRYIEQAAEQAAVMEKNLLAEVDSLRHQLAEKDGVLTEAQTKLEQLAVQSAQRESELEEQVIQARNEADALRPDAEAYAQFRERLGTIEFEARKRASDLEETAAAQLRRTVDLFREQYQTLMNSFETAASHAGNELRKMEVTLSQLPRAMDQSGVELNELAAHLERIKEQ